MCILVLSIPQLYQIKRCTYLLLSVVTKLNKSQILFQVLLYMIVVSNLHCNIPKVVSYAKWWYGIFQYHTTIHPISYHYLNSGMILENTIPPFAIRKRQSS